MTIADLSCICELSQSLAIDLDLSDYPNIKAWIERCFSIKEIGEMNKT